MLVGHDDGNAMLKSIKQQMVKDFWIIDLCLMMRLCKRKGLKLENRNESWMLMANTTNWNGIILNV